MAEATMSSFPLEKEIAEEELAHLVRKPGFDGLTVGDIVRHMNNRFNVNFDAYRKELREMVMKEITKRNKEQGNEESGSSSSSDSGSESDNDSDDEETEKKESKKEEKEKPKEAKKPKQVKKVKEEASDSDSGVEDTAVVVKRKNTKKASSNVESDMASNIKSSRRAAASKAINQITKTSESRGRHLKKKVKDPNADNSGKFGPMTKLCYISPELQQVTKDQWMKRCDVVKVLWDYIKENNLKDPKNGQFIICDTVFESIFKKNRVKAFGMAKFLTKHIIGTSDMNPEMRQEAEDEMIKRRAEWLERKALKDEEAREGSSNSEAEPPAAKKPKVEESNGVKQEEESSSESD